MSRRCGGCRVAAASTAGVALPHQGVHLRGCGAVPRVRPHAVCSRTIVGPQFHRERPTADGRAVLDLEWRCRRGHARRFQQWAGPRCNGAPGVRTRAGSARQAAPHRPGRQDRDRERSHRSAQRLSMSASAHWSASWRVHPPCAAGLPCAAAGASGQRLRPRQYDVGVLFLSTSAFRRCASCLANTASSASLGPVAGHAAGGPSSLTVCGVALRSGSGERARSRCCGTAVRRHHPRPTSAPEGIVSICHLHCREPCRRSCGSL